MFFYDKYNLFLNNIYNICIFNNIYLSFNFKFSITDFKSKNKFFYI